MGNNVARKFVYILLFILVLIPLALLGTCAATGGISMSLSGLIGLFSRQGSSWVGVLWTFVWGPALIALAYGIFRFAGWIRKKGQPLLKDDKSDNVVDQ